MIVVINSSLYVITMSFVAFFVLIRNGKITNHLPDEFVNWGVIVNLFSLMKSVGWHGRFVLVEFFQKLRKGVLPGEKSFASFIQLYA